MRLAGGGGWAYGSTLPTVLAGGGSAPPSTFTVSGTVLDSDGNPYVGDGTGLVDLTDTGGLDAYGPTPIAADGTWSIGLVPSGTYKVRITPNGLDVGHVETWYDQSPDQGGALPVVVAADVTGLVVQLLAAGP